MSERRGGPDLDARHAPGGRRVLRLGPAVFVVRPRALIVGLALLLVALAAGTIALGVGAIVIPVAEVPAALLGLSDDPVRTRVLQGIRLPRVLAALGAGAALGISGAVFQSISRNALGSPDVIGFTTGAASGALAQIVIFGGGAEEIALGALIGGLGTAAAVVLLARRAGAIHGRQLVLVGIGVGAVLSALNALLLVRGDLDSAASANAWLSGSLDARTWAHALPALLAVALLLPVVLLLVRGAELMEMGDDLAQQLGVPVAQYRLALVACAVLLASAATAAAGPIAFVALAAPQLVRRLSGGSGVPALGAALMGAALLVIADLVTQVLPLGFTVPIGRMTGIVGGLYLVWLLLPSRSRAGKGIE